MHEKEIIEIASSFRKGLLSKDTSTKKCFMVCIALHGYLRVLGLEVLLIKGEVHLKDEIWEHYWLELNNGRILDPTFDQFGNKEEVYLGKLPDNYRKDQ